jgi:hypothetical protein
MTVDRRVLAAALATLLLVAACGGSATQAPAATQAPGATEAAAETTAPAETQEPTETQAPTEGPEVSLIPGAAGDLEAKLPSEVNGVKFQKGSFNGSNVPGGIPIGEGDDDFAKFLSDNGKSLNDVRIAIASPTDAEAAGSLVMAIQIKGTPSDKLIAFATKDSSDMEKSTVGGKEVFGAAAGGFGAYFYVKDDVIFYILSMGGDASLAEGILRQLP